jgi:hypothetical protein
MQNFGEKIENFKKIWIFALKMIEIMPIPAKYAISGPIRL